MKVIIAVVVYDRVKNIRRWLDCWKQCNQREAELVVIHNENTPGDAAILSNICHEAGIRYIPRENTGMDIGAFQDVCKERLDSFPNDWDVLLWCTDDTLPMRKDFLKPFMDHLNTASVACIMISQAVNPHIRTTGFAIRKNIAKEINFLRDPITTKADCYMFEHLDPNNNFYRQMLDKQFRVAMVTGEPDSPLWDSGHIHGINREMEFMNIFEAKQKIAVICTIYDEYPQIISSMLCQTYTNWELILLDDKPRAYRVKNFSDKRITYIQRPHLGNYGHPHRQWALNELKAGRLSPDANYVVITNADNYHVPCYLEHMLRGFNKHPKAVLVYCSEMVHSYVHWQTINCSISLGKVDCAGVMIRKDAACEAGWRDIEGHSSDWTYISDVVKDNRSPDVVAKVKGCLLIHN